MIDTLDAFHFLRPLWLLALIGIAALWYLARKNAVPARRSRDSHPHLARPCGWDPRQARRFYPDRRCCQRPGLLSLWPRPDQPGAAYPTRWCAETAPLVVALKVTQSMETPDLAPTRLDRARFKILDLINERAGARTALIAYAGTAHRVSPLTEDPNILRPLLQGLNRPAVMPVDGDDAAAALAAGARDRLKRRGDRVPSCLFWMT